MAGIYIHIPFCRQACTYCDFHFSTQLKNRNSLIQAIQQELIQRKDYLKKEPIKSIYFGGGTPSLISASSLEMILKEIDNQFILAEDVEICLEANPEDLYATYLSDIKKSGINRLSIGVQSFHQKDLDLMNRKHSGKDAIIAIKTAQDKGFENISMDLIFGSPSTSNQMWEENLRQFFSLELPHLSAYSLTIEDKTALKYQIEKGIIAKPKDERAYKQYQSLQNQIAKAGYEQYELSNYCKNKQYSRHNSAYWKQVPYLGLGPSAHSFDGNSRQWNVANNSLYVKSIKNGAPAYEKEVLSENDKYHDLLITSLRNKWGLSLPYLKDNFSNKTMDSFNKKLNQIPEGRLEKTKDTIHVKKEFWFQADSIIRQLWLD